jgi:hypothetical protein
MENVNQNDEVVKLYGEFLIRFEHVCHALRFGILYIIFPDQTAKQIRYNEILMQNITGDELRKKYVTLMTEEFEKDSEMLKLSITVSQIFEKLIPLRNSFAHGTSFIGKNEFMAEANDGLLVLRHPKLTKTGLDLNFKKIEIVTLKETIKMFEKLQNAIYKVAVLCKGRDKPREYDPTRVIISAREELIRLNEKLKISLP